jgi:integrase
LPGNTLRRQIRMWLADGEVRDARGQHVNVTAHQFRHTLATRMINNDVPLAVIRRLLDHSSTSMTEVYARLSRPDPQTRVREVQPARKHPRRGDRDRPRRPGQRRRVDEGATRAR